MITHSKQLLILALILYPFQSSSLDFPTREVSIGVSAFAIGAFSTFIGSSWYHPAALAKKELELAQAEKNKKEQAERIEKERQHAAELERLHAENRLLYIKHTYSDEFERLRKEKLNERDALFNIIRENCGMHDLPFNHYHVVLTQNLELLRNLEMALPSDKQQERLTLISNLERISKIYNGQIADKAKHEKEDAESKRRKEETELRKIEKEQLEIRKLQLEVDTIKEEKHKLDHIHVKLDTIANKITTATGKQSEQTQEVMGSVNALRIKQAQDAEDLKKIINKGNETLETKFALLFKLFEQARTFVNTILSQQQAAVQTPPPPYNPEVYPQMQKPSAPPI